MESYRFLVDLMLILLCTKLLSIITKRFHLPQVVGALLAGLILGPAVLGWIGETEFIDKLSKLGVIVLMFCAGLETDIVELKKAGKASFIIALVGVVVPLLGGFIVAYIFNQEHLIASDATAPMMLQNVFIGIILTATSVSITVETLRELGKLHTRAGNAILGAAIIDDVLGVIGLTVITSMADSSVSVWLVLIKILLYFVFALIVGVIFYKLFEKWISMYNRDKRRFVIAAFVFCLFMAFSAEYYFGVADITGAYIAGLIISGTERTKFIASRFNTLSFILLSPIFFVSIGLKVSLPTMSAPVVWFSLILVVVAIITKIVGCGLGAKICGFKNDECFQIGAGMISRGEVALIIADKGAALGLMGSAFFGPVVIVVVATTILAPLFLKVAFKNKEELIALETTEKEYPYNKTDDKDLVLNDAHTKKLKEKLDKSHGKSRPYHT